MEHALVQRAIIRAYVHLCVVVRGLVVSKAGTRDDGSPVIVCYALGIEDQWKIPTFVQLGKGQFGDWDFDKIVEFDWRIVLSTLPEPHFDELFTEDIRVHEGLPARAM